MLGYCSRLDFLEADAEIELGVQDVRYTFYGLNSVPSNSHLEALIPSTSEWLHLEIGALKR